jgi:single-strand DNA-binding protein
MALNKVILMGRLTADPELSSTPQGVSVARFTLAVDRSYGERKADFINCVAWRNTGEFISKYFSKGKMIAVVGEIQTRTWDKPDGAKGYATEVNVTEASFAGDKKDDATPAPNITPDTIGNYSDDELPF